MNGWRDRTYSGHAECHLDSTRLRLNLAPVLYLHAVQTHRFTPSNYRLKMRGLRSVDRLIWVWLSHRWLAWQPEVLAYIFVITGCIG